MNTGGYSVTGEEKPKRKLRGFSGIAFSLVSLAILTFIAVSLITGRGPDLSWFADLFSPRAHVEPVQEFHFDVGNDRMFADLDSALAAAGTVGIQVFDIGGSETLRDSFRMSVPAISSSNGRAIAYDIGGTAVRVFGGTQLFASVEAAGTVVSASINRNGWFCVNTQESGSQRGVATVYNDSAGAVYRVNLASGYILSSVLSSDNKSLAVLNLTDSGSRITLYNGLNKPDPDSAFELTGGLILDMRYLSGGDLLVVSTDSLIMIDRNGTSRTLFEYFDKRLGGYALDENVVFLHLLDFGVGYSGRLVTLDKAGNTLGEIVTDRELLSMSFGGGYLAVLQNDGVMFYNANLEDFPSSGEQIATAGASQVLALGNGSALVAGDHSAVVINRGD